MLDDAKHWWKLVEVNIENTIKKKACDKTINGLDHQHCLQQKRTKIWRI